MKVPEELFKDVEERKEKYIQLKSSFENGISQLKDSNPEMAKIFMDLFSMLMVHINLTDRGLYALTEMVQHDFEEVRCFLHWLDNKLDNRSERKPTLQ